MRQLVGYTGEVDGMRARLEIWDDGRIEYARPLGEPHPFVAVPARCNDVLSSLDSLRRYRVAPGLEELIESTLAMARREFGDDWRAAAVARGLYIWDKKV